MKNLIPLFFLIVLSCQSNVVEPPKPEPIYEICASDYSKNLSYTPTDKVIVNAAGKNIEIDFTCNESLTEHIFNYAERLHDTVHTLGKLADAYKIQRATFWPGASSLYLPPYYDADYIFPKLEYLLAQECMQNNCCSDTRKAILRMAVDKQKLKSELTKQYYMTHSALQTGEFLMAVILVKENDRAFINALGRDVDLRNALSLNIINIQISSIYRSEFEIKMIQFAENFLKR